MMSQPMSRPAISAALTISGHAQSVEIIHAEGRTIQLQGDVDIVIGDRLMLTLSRSEQESVEVLVEVVQGGSHAGRPAWSLRIHTDTLPPWLARLLNTRSAFRVDADPDERIEVVLRAGGRGWRGSLADASQEGVAMLCGSSLETISQIGSTGTVSMVLPEGRCQFSVRLCRLKDISGQCRIGMELVDDGTLQHRRSLRFLCDYVMRRQREIAQKHIKL